ncbi:EamA domain-containing membrane protein RarD [Jannaschia faecimaris]|uniref:EamA domain-containing membrane protein RarD n=1 Tax=Jannaschia faecimaris TaxID=1244108 RepID=A0A1H3PMP6_9RHOB|nr:DMT family transporter [Jannaschia faecimaris]SDZ02190.1 EamA domain-containing membrane protein RarD [Jannaschia faecimaris]
MIPLRTDQLATMVVVASGGLWGFYWIPVRALTDLGLAGAWGTLAITGGAVLVLLLLLARHRAALCNADRVALGYIALGGAAFALYSISFVYGRVAIVILLYFLTPVWSVLIGRYVMGWRTTRLRLLAIAVGLTGLAVMLGADGQAPIPRGFGEWIALAAGVLWSVATTGMRVRSDLPPLPSAFVFALGATVVAAIMAPILDPVPVDALTAGASSLAMVALPTGALWWGLSTIGLMWAAVRLDPARVGMLLMSEVLVGAASAALLAGEHMARLEIIGGALVLFAGVLEVWPDARGGEATAAPAPPKR